jgi:hypothetical protein
MTGGAKVIVGLSEAVESPTRRTRRLARHRRAGGDALMSRPAGTGPARRTAG